MWNIEIKTAIQKRQQITISLHNGEVLEGIPEVCTDRVKIWSLYGAAWVPLEEIKHVCRLIQLSSKV